jgi:hypothetical protein
MVRALCYNLEAHRFDAAWGHSGFSITYSFRPHYVPGLDSASNRNEYQGHVLGGEAAGAYG